MKKYRVLIDQTWSCEVIVSAKSKAEAERKAFKKWKPKKKDFTLHTECESD